MQSALLVDILIILGLLIYVLAHYKEGVFALTRRLAGFIGGAIIAFVVYPDISTVIAPHTGLQPGVVDAVAFLISFIIIQWTIKFILRNIFSLFPHEFEESRVSRMLAVVPAAIDGLILISLVLFIIVVSPFFISAKGPIEDSQIGGTLVDKASGVETYIDKVFGKATEESLGFLTVEPEEGESVSLPFKATNIKVDESAEMQMLSLVNDERRKAGLAPLVMDQTLRQVARLHSADMWTRQYFAHTNPDGLDPFDRMHAGGAAFHTAGENLALARTVERAMEGLMNSPGHKRNILDPNFKRVGIGAVDGGVYGMMFTQDFSD